MNGLMAIPNLIGLPGLSGVIVVETNRFPQGTGGTGRNRSHRGNEAARRPAAVAACC